MWRAAAVLSLFLALPAVGETPADRWRTVETAHFRIHYPQPYEEWALRAAGRIESIREAVAREVGYAAPQKTDVIVMNPEGLANGSALPLLDAPRIVLWAEAPGPDEQIGEYGDWIELLLVHEVAHLQHLLRPSRNPLRRQIARLVPFGPLVLSAPRWVTEGYATVVEGRLTGSGRPSSAIRAAILRKWAGSGSLPSYDDLGSGRRFLGMSMAYLAGSAFLEWLEGRGGEGSLRKLWARMSARRPRSFDEAFQGVYGEPAERLYGAFVAELTERAVNVDRESRDLLREGVLWQETKRSSGDPAVSPDGKRIALVLRDEKGESELVVLATGEPTEEEKKESERIAKVLERDPEDVAPVRTKPIRRKPLHSLRLPLSGGISTPRWMPGGESILFGHRSMERDGDRHHDLYVWTIESGRVRRITWNADVREADPLEDGRRAVAVRSRYGRSQLVLVDLASGSVSDLTPPSVGRVISHPRSRGGKVAFVAHAEGAWRLFVRDLATGVETPLAAAGNTATPEWGRDGDIYATVFAGGFIEIHRFAQDGSNAPVTRSTGGAFEPAPAGDGRLFFMGLDPDGFNLRLLTSTAAAPARAPADRSFVPALPPERAAPAVFEVRPPGSPRDYGIGRQELDFILSGTSVGNVRSTELGLRSGDVVGRLDLLALAAFGSRTSQRGVAVAAAWRGSPVEIRGHLYRSKESLPWSGKPQAVDGALRHAGPRGRRVRGEPVQPAVPAPNDTSASIAPRGFEALRSLDIDQSGLELRGVWASRFETGRVVVEAGGLARSDASLGFLHAEALLRQRHTRQLFEVSGEAGGTRHVRARGRLEGRAGGLTLGAEGQLDRSSGDEKPEDSLLLGGAAGSVLPRSAFANRVLDPALDPATRSGKRYEGIRLDASIGPLTFFQRMHDLDGRMTVRGLEITGTIPPTPLLQLPGMHVSFGGGRVRGENRWWVAVRLEP